MVVKKGTHLDLRRVSDELCREYGLSVIEEPNVKTPRSIYQAEKRGELTKYSLMRDAIDRSIAVSYEPKDLAWMLKLYGYVINATEKRKYVTICAVGGRKPTRLYQLGNDYTIGRTRERILQNDRDVQLNQPRYQKILTQKAPNLHFHGNLKQAPKKTVFGHYIYTTFTFSERYLREIISRCHRLCERNCESWTGTLSSIIFFPVRD